jgi:antimicrobial peptide system SdpB family protein
MERADQNPAAMTVDLPAVPHSRERMPWTNVYGLARSAIAMCTLATLLVNDPSILWHAASGVREVPICSDFVGRTSLFCMMSGHLSLARWIAVGLLAIVAVGWRPRLTAPIHWWVTHSFVMTSLVVDGGDHLSAVMSLLLLPLALTDGRRWHWDAPRPLVDTRWSNLRFGLAMATLWLLRLQMAFVYLNAAAAKWSVREWSDGTALYYWFSDPAFGLTPPLRAAFGWTLSNAFTVTLMTWGVIAFEFVLFGALFMRDRRPRQVLLALGIAFHFGIILVHGLPSFAIVMWGGLILLLRHEHETFDLPWRRVRAPALTSTDHAPLAPTTSRQMGAA